LHALSDSLLLQSRILDLGAHVSEGQLVESVPMPFWHLARALPADRNPFYQLEPRKFEELIAGYYDAERFDEVTLTPRSGEDGRDAIATKHGHFSIRVLDQAKPLKQAGPSLPTR
jgi:restriction system protein